MFTTLTLSIYKYRSKCVRDWVENIENHEGGLDEFSQAYKYYGIHFQQDGSVVVREWAPGAVQVYLTGDFSKFKYKIGIVFISNVTVTFSFNFVFFGFLSQIIGSGKQIH